MAFSSPPELLLRNAIRGQSMVAKPRFNSSSAAGGTYKAAMCTELGAPLLVQEVPRETELLDGMVRLGIHCAGVNFADILATQGKYQEKPPLPFVPGGEISGEILEVGPGVNHVQVGDRVFGMIGIMGGFAEEAIAPAVQISKIPGHISYEQAASFLCNYGTAWMALTRKANIKPGETVLVTAAAGGVGLAAVDIATNIFNCKVIGACGGPDKAAIVRQKGAVEVIDYNKESVRARTKEITNGKGADIIFDAVGGKIFDEALRSIAFEGRIIVIGFASGTIPKIPANYLLVKSASAVGVYWGSYSYLNPPAFVESITRVSENIVKGKLSPHTSAAYPLEQINDAFQLVLNRKSTGKVVVNCR